MELPLPEGIRVTLAVGSAPTPCFFPAFSDTMLEGRVVSPGEPRRQLGLYWGYHVRVARGLSRVLKEAPYKVRKWDHSRLLTTSYWWLDFDDGTD